MNIHDALTHAAKKWDRPGKGYRSPFADIVDGVCRVGYLMWEFDLMGAPKRREVVKGTGRTFEDAFGGGRNG